MSSFEQIKSVVQSCLKNAEELLQAAKASQAIGANGAAYHLAALALEEVGKSTLVLIAGTNEERAKHYFDTAEDHEKKLFWALWIPAMNSGELSGQQLQDFHELARQIHQRRLGAIYVHARTGIRLSVAPGRVKEIIGLAEARVGMEKLVELREPDEETVAHFAWFESATDDRTLRKGLIFTRDSFDKLKELSGNANLWIRWLHAQADESEQEARQLLQQELSRERPEDEEGRKPKWKLRIKLFSDSHSIRSGPLNKWNERVDFIKLARADSNTLFVELSIPKGVHVNGLFQAGLHMASRFVVALNVGTFGLQYWYLPTFVSRYHDRITDVENDRTIEMELKPSTKIDWGQRRALTDEDLNKCGIVFTYMARFGQDQLAAIDHYLRGLALLCKSDIFLGFENAAIQGFLVTVRELMRLNKDWDGAEPLKNAAERTVKDFVDSMPDMLRVLKLAESIEHRVAGAAATMHDAYVMKAFCDVYIVRKAYEAVHRHIESKDNS